MRMSFRARTKEPPEINLIPFIDVLLVILIFLMLSTTYNRFTELQINLPMADAQSQQSRPRELVVAIDREGRYSINRIRLAHTDVQALASAMQQGAQGSGGDLVVINADAQTPHQAVISALQAARLAGLQHISFAAQKPGLSGKP
jgi:biopolymer transport protein ExbD